MDVSEVASIEGFDEETGAEIQARAQDYLDRETAELDGKRKELGVEDGVLAIEGITLPMAVALGAGDVKSVEDLAGLVPDDLRGWFESKNGERVRQSGVLETFNLEPQDAELLIMRARVVMGWIEAPEEPEPEVEAEGEAELTADDVFAPSPEAVAEAQAVGEAQDS